MILAGRGSGNREIENVVILLILFVYTVCYVHFFRVLVICGLKIAGWRQGEVRRWVSA